MTRLLPAGRSVRRALRRYRRPLAALLAAATTWAALHALAPPAPPTVPLAVAARDLAAGAVLGPDDVTSVDVPAGAVPDGATSPAPGTVLDAPLRRGEAVTDVRLVRAGQVRRPAGTVVLSVRTADPAAVLAVRPGDRVDLLAGPAGTGLPDVDGAGTAEPAELLGSGVLVLEVPGRPDGGGAGSGADGDGSASGGLLGGDVGGAAPVDTAGVLLVAADRPTAARVAAAAGRSLTVAVVSP